MRRLILALALLAGLKPIATSAPTMVAPVVSVQVATAQSLQLTKPLLIPAR